MTVATLRTFQITPGRRADFNAVLAEQRKQAEDFGATIRIWQTAFAGESSGRVIVIGEYPNYTAMAEALERYDSAPSVPMWDSLQGANPPAKLVSASILVEMIP